MTPIEQRVQELEQRLARMEKSDRYTINKLLQMGDARNIQLGVTTGTKIGTATTQKLAFYGTTPIAQQSLPTVPTAAQIAVLLQLYGLANLT